MKGHKKVFLDTNVFLNAYIRDELNAKILLKAIRYKDHPNYKFYTATLVIAEIAWTSKSFYKLTKKEILSILKSISKNTEIKVLDKYDTSEAISLFEKHNIKYADCAIYSAINSTWYVLSYDKEFDKLTKNRIEVEHLLSAKI